MPAFVKTPADEKTWARAKQAVLDSRELKESDMSDEDWGLVTHIYKAIKRKGKVIEGDKLLKIIEGAKAALAKVMSPHEYVDEVSKEYRDMPSADDKRSRSYLDKLDEQYDEVTGDDDNGDEITAASVIQPATLKLAKTIAREVFTASELKSAGVAMDGDADAFAASIKKGGLAALVRTHGPALSKAMRKHCADATGLGECTRAVALLTRGK